MQQLYRSLDISIHLYGLVARDCDSTKWHSGPIIMIGLVCVIFNVWVIIRDPVTWERPDKFVPERFLGMADADQAVDFRGKAFEFIPFGSGRRLCPGVPMAERVVPFILACLLRAFEWRLPDGVSAEELDVSERFTTANVMAVPLKVVPVVVT
ncbi:cytochrome P450 76M5-like [Triticum dicoccoides]|uniref:cytochrome P450 76M5-like n=1 Tax=Triticum dicoccoides TaxID=85692 RepID=UPI00188F24FC|nr:cytochrome P450 76M5-like [Triticum dicoccoides]